MIFKKNPLFEDPNPCKKQISMHSIGNLMSIQLILVHISSILIYRSTLWPIQMTENEL